MMPPMVPGLANPRRDFATFNKHAPHKSGAPRNWPDHPTISCCRGTGIKTHILCLFARTLSTHAANKPTVRADFAAITDDLDSSRASFLGCLIAGG
jgi:hypothetical protein